jgi:hypothetical protein
MPRKLETAEHFLLFCLKNSVNYTFFVLPSNSTFSLVFGGQQNLHVVPGGELKLIVIYGVLWPPPFSEIFSKILGKFGIFCRFLAPGNEGIWTPN